jgi:acetolactate synthase-1/2/3 large subunit
MNGAEALLRTLADGGVEVCFTNPGTSEMHLVDALARVAAIRPILGLFEGVATGAADGYARLAGKPAVTLLHLGPGLANGVANLHNARRAEVPIVNLVGEHPDAHLRHDAPLTSDIAAIARPVSAWVHRSAGAAALPMDGAAAIMAARTAPGRIATLIVPADAAWGEGAEPCPLPPQAPPLPAAASRVAEAARLLRSDLPTALLLSCNALYGTGLQLAGSIAAKTGAALLSPFPVTRLERGAGRPVVTRLPYVPDQAAAILAGYRQFILVGAPVPAAYFAYPGREAVLTPPDAAIFTLAAPGEDYVATLADLASALGAGTFASQPLEPAAPPSGAITLPGLAAAIAATLPEQAIVIDEGMTSGRSIMAATKGSAPHDWLGNTGGSIGIALPLAVGAAVAAPDRPVLCLSGDGSAMYTLQGLWSMAREGLAVTVVIFANRAYAILKHEYARIAPGEPGPRVGDMFALDRPEIDWVSLARGMGVPAVRVDTLEGFAAALHAGYASRGPNLIEVPL